jgi:hypothetical protein
MLIAQLHDRRSAFRNASGEIGERMPTGARRIDQRIETKIEGPANVFLQ